MTNHSLQSIMVGSGAADLGDVWVRIEQLIPPEVSQFASIRDVYQLWLSAATGKSAQKLRAVNCPVEFDGSDIHVYLGFYAWPSYLDLPYDLTPSIGTIGERQVIRKRREFSAFIDNQNRLDLPYYMEEVTAEWETPTFDRYGEQITRPSITNHNTWIEFSSEVFGSLRVSGVAFGSYQVAEMIVTRELTEEEIPAEELADQQHPSEDTYIVTPLPTKRLNGYIPENLDNTITAAWIAADGTTATEQMQLEIPQCVQDVLSFCPDMYKTLLLWCRDVATRQVYYNTCKKPAEVIAIFDDVDPRSYCEQMQVNDGFDPGWLL